MSGQVQSKPPHRDDDDSETDQQQVSKQTHEVDDILAEIDATLERNAEAFVNGFVQKGGE